MALTVPTAAPVRGAPRADPETCLAPSYGLRVGRSVPLALGDGCRTAFAPRGGAPRGGRDASAEPEAGAELADQADPRPAGDGQEEAAGQAGPLRRARLQGGEAEAVRRGLRPGPLPARPARHQDQE